MLIYSINEKSKDTLEFLAAITGSTIVLLLATYLCIACILKFKPAGSFCNKNVNGPYFIGSVDNFCSNSGVANEAVKENSIKLR